MLAGDPVDYLNVYAWDYDDGGRLILESLDSSDDSLDYTDTFVWDLTGNRLSTTRVWGSSPNENYTTTYTYDANDRLITETKDVHVGTASDEVTTYAYDFTQQTSKTKSVGGTTVLTQTSEYDLQGRLAEVTSVHTNGANDRTEVVTYDYDSAGNRVAMERQVDIGSDGSIETHTRTEYLTDEQNHTGYSQVLQETEFDGVTGLPIKKTVYAIGHDQISQTVYQYVDTNSDGTPDAWDSGETHYFGTDGHGSVRVLFNLFNKVVEDLNGVDQVFHFDAFGNLLNFADGVQPLTSYLYSGESFDFNIGQQYLRARWYDPATGRFNRLDPFFGNSSDPQSFHKYAYVHGDPVQGIDPTGEFLLGLTVRSFFERSQYPTFSAALSTVRILAGRASGAVFRLFAPEGLYAFTLRSLVPTGGFNGWLFAAGQYTFRRFIFATLGQGAFRYGFSLGLSFVTEYYVESNGLPVVSALNRLAAEAANYNGSLAPISGLISETATAAASGIQARIEDATSFGLREIAVGQVGGVGSFVLNAGRIGGFFTNLAIGNAAITAASQAIFESLPQQQKLEVQRRLNIPAGGITSVSFEPQIGNLFLKGFNNRINADREVDLLRIIGKQADAGNWDGAANDLVVLFNRLGQKYGRVTVQ